MPYEQVYVPAEILVDLGDTLIYWTYKNDDANTPLSYWYTATEDSNSNFDVRDLSTYSADGEKAASEQEARPGEDPVRTYHAQVIREAYESEELLEFI